MNASKSAIFHLLNVSKKNMKNTILLVLIMLWSGYILSQNLIINETNSGGTSVPFQDTLIYPPYNTSSSDFYFDFDQDSIYDIKFNMNKYTGGSSWYSKISVFTYNNFFIHLDTNYQHHHYFYYNGFYMDTVIKTTVVKKYALGDTIYSNVISSQGEEYFHNVEYLNGIGEYISKINLFYGDTSYIAFTKNHLDTLSIYYLKVHINSGDLLYLSSLKTNDLESSIEELEQFYNKIKLYPNPTTGRFLIDINNFEKIEIYNTSGVLIKQTTQKEINLEAYPKGIYFVKIYTSEHEINKKLLLE